MRYYELSDDVRIVNRWHFAEVTTGRGLEPLLFGGVRCVVDSGLTVKVHKPGRELDFCLTGFAVPIVRASLGAAIEGVAGEDVERLPVSILGHVGFEVLNCLSAMRCLDEERSNFLKWTTSDHRSDLAGRYRMVTNLRIRGSEIPANHHIFRIEGWPIALIVSESMKVTMESAGCFGATFTEVT